MKLNKKTADYVLSMLNNHREFCDSAKPGREQQEQIAYYRGLIDMCNAILAEGQNFGTAFATYDGEKHEIWY